MDLLDRIDWAFATVPPPDEPDLLEADGCHCEECRWGVKDLIGQDWRTLTFEDEGMDRSQSIIRNISSSAFRFFLPGLMKLTLQPDYDSGDMIERDIVEMLTRSDADRDLDRNLAAVQRRIDLLSLSQREVIGNYLDSLGCQDLWRNFEELLSAHQNLASGRATPYSR